MKKVSIFIIMIIVMSAVICLISNTTRASQIIDATDTLQAAIDKASPGDVIQLLNKTYSDKAVNINKDLTIRGAGNSRNGLWTMNIVKGANNVKIENMVVSAPISDDFKFIDVQTKTNLEISNLNLVFITRGKTETVDGENQTVTWDIDTQVINVGPDATGSTININNSMIHGMFDSIKISSSNNTINAKGTKISSDCAIILENGSNNHLKFSDCTISAGSSLIPSEEECISIKNQQNSTINFEDTVIEGIKVYKEKPDDLISFDDENSSNVQIRVTDTGTGKAKIVNGNTSQGSDIFNFGESSLESGNSIFVEKGIDIQVDHKDTYNAPEDLKPATVEEKYNENEKYAVVGVYSNEGVTIKQYEKNKAIPNEDLPKTKIEGASGIPGKMGYELENWYSDADFKTQFNVQNEITQNMDIYPKYKELVYITIGNYNFEIEKGKKLSEVSGKRDLTNAKTVEEALNIINIVDGNHSNFLRYVDNNGETVEKESTTFEANAIISPVFSVKISIKGGKTNKEFEIEENKTFQDLMNEKQEEINSEVKQDTKEFSHFVDSEETQIKNETVFSKNTELTAKYKVKVSIKDTELSVLVDEGSNLNSLSNDAKGEIEKLKKADGKDFSHFENGKGEKIEMTTALKENTELVRKYTVTVTINGQEFVLDEGESLDSLKSEDETRYNNLVNVEGKDFAYFLDNNNERVEKTEHFSKHTTLTIVFEIKIKVVNGDLEADFVLQDGKSLNDLDTAKKEELDDIILKDYKTFIYFEDEKGTLNITKTTKFNKHTKLTPKYIVDVKVGDKRYILREGESLSNLTQKQQEEISKIVKVEKKQFSHFVDQEQSIVNNDTPISKNSVLTPKYTVKITIDNQDFVLNEGETLENLNEEGKQALSKVEVTQDFSRFVDEAGNTINREIEFHKNTTLTAKFNKTVTVKEEQFKIEEGKALKDLGENELNRLEQLIHIEGKNFLHFIDEENAIIAMDTPITKNCTLTPKYNIKITVKGTNLEFGIQEGQTLQSLSKEDIDKLNELKNIKDKKFLKFVDQDGTTIEMDTVINENKELTAKYSVEVTIGDKKLTLNEGESLETLGEEATNALNELKVSDREFSRFADSEGNTVELTTKFNKNTTIIAKFKIILTVGNETFKLEEGKKLKDLDNSDKEKLEELKVPKFWQKFVKLINNETKEEVNDNTIFNENTSLQVVFENIEQSTVDNNSKCVAYRTHVQEMGWQVWKQNGEVSGTSNRGLRLEGIEIKLQNMNVSGGIEYTTHVQNEGWQTWKQNGEMAGTSGKSYRLEAIRIKLTGDLANKYDIYYRVHSQNFGWMGWAKNGEESGTSGYGYRLEAIQIKLVEKGLKAPGDTSNAFRKAPPSVLYTTHVQNEGWQDEVKDRQVSGTLGKSYRLEGIKIHLNNSIGGGIEYTTHVQNEGWQSWVENGKMAGTSGKSYRLEAIKIKLTGEMANKYDIYYRVHSQNFGWMGWAKNGEESGTSGYSYRLEAIQIVLVEKGGNAPGDTKDAYKVAKQK